MPSLADVRREGPTYWPCVQPDRDRSCLGDVLPVQRPAQRGGRRVPFLTVSARVGIAAVVAYRRVENLASGRAECFGIGQLDLATVVGEYRRAGLPTEWVGVAPEVGPLDDTRGCGLQLGELFQLFRTEAVGEDPPVQ